MKKLLITMAFCCALCTVFAQKTFRQLNYYTGGGTPGPLDYGVFNTIKPRALTGVINISLIDSTVTLSNGNTKIAYKIKTVQPEVTDQNGNKRLTIACDPQNGSTTALTILRDPVNTAKKEMTFIIKYPDGSGREYACVYLINLFEN